MITFILEIVIFLDLLFIQYIIFQLLPSIFEFFIIVIIEISIFIIYNFTYIKIIM